MHQIEAKNKKKLWKKPTYDIDQTLNPEGQCDAINAKTERFTKCREYKRKGRKSYKNSTPSFCTWSRQGERCILTGNKYDPKKYACDDIPKRRYCKQNDTCQWNHEDKECENRVITPCAGRTRFDCKNECQVLRGVEQEDGTKGYKCINTPVQGLGFAGPQICIHAFRDIHEDQSASLYNIDFIVSTTDGMCEISIPLEGTSNDGSKYSCCPNTSGELLTVFVQATSNDGFYGSFHIKQYEGGALWLVKPLRYGEKYKFWIDGNGDSTDCNNLQMCPLNFNI